MNNNNIHEFAKLMAVMGEYYGAISREAQEIYWQGLKDHEMSKIWEAFWCHIRSPKQGQFRPLVAHLLLQIEMPIKNQARQAWLMVIKAIQRFGAYETVRFNDPTIINVIVDLGGWIHLCHLKTQELIKLKETFIDLYQHYCEKPTLINDPMRGIVDQKNQEIGDHNVCYIDFISESSREAIKKQIALES